MVFLSRGTLCLYGKFVFCISFRFGRHRLLQRRPSDSIVHLAIVDCTGDTVQLALYSTTAVSVSLISIFPDRKNLHYPKYCIFDAYYKLVNQKSAPWRMPAPNRSFGSFPSLCLNISVDSVWAPGIYLFTPPPLARPSEALALACL